MKNKIKAVEDAEQPQPDKDVSEIESRLSQSQEVNAAADRYSVAIEARAAAQETLEKAEADQLDREKALAKARKAKDALFETCPLPDDKLSVVDGDLWYDGKPWDSMGTSAQVRVCATIVTKLKPDCKFILVDELESFDPKRLVELDLWAKKNGIQIIGTRVSKGPECDLIIEEGMVKDGHAVQLGDGKPLVETET